MRVVDQCTDSSGRQLHRIVTLYGLDALVKDRNPDRIGINGAQKYAAANRLPCDTPESTIVSYAFLRGANPELSGEDFAYVANKLRKQAERFNCTAALASIDERAGTLAKEATADLPDNVFAYVFESNGEKERRLRLLNPAEVKVAAEWLRAYRESFSYEDRRKIAEKIVDRAAALDVAGDDHLDFAACVAGRGQCMPKLAAIELNRRAAIVKPINKDAAIELEKIARIIAGCKLLSAEIRTKMAMQIDDIDKKFQLRRQSTVTPPEDFLFNLTRTTLHKVAEEHIELVTGEVYKTSDFHGLPIESIRHRLGDAAAEALTEDGITVSEKLAAEIVPTMPRRDAMQFVAWAAAHGVQPKFKQAGIGIGLDRQTIQELSLIPV